MTKKETNNVESISTNFTFGVQAELSDDLKNLVAKYEGRLSLAQFLGVLEIVRFDLLKGQYDE